MESNRLNSISAFTVFVGYIVIKPDTNVLTVANVLSLYESAWWSLEAEKKPAEENGDITQSDVRKSDN